MPWPGDICFSMWEEAYASGPMVFPHGGTVLEVGCAEADWIAPLKAERPDLHVTGIDWRDEERPAADRRIHGDVLAQEFPRQSFDVIVGISSIEHIGLGHYDHDPLDVDGDRHACDRIGEWLKPGGWFYADVPYEDAYRVVGTSHRCYDDRALIQRLLPPGCIAEKIWHFPYHVHAGMAYVALLARKR